MGPAFFRILDLPVELIVEIAICAQHIWQEEVLLTHGPHAGAKRLAVEIPRTAVRREACCRSLDRTTVPCCWLASTPKDTLTPARCMAQTCARLRGILLVDNSQIWELDNALYPQPGSRVTTGSAASTATQNRAQNLAVVRACVHALNPLKRRYASVRRARLALPWDYPDDPSSNVEAFFARNHTREPSLLQRLDLEIYDSPRAPVQPVMNGLRIDGLQTYRSLNSSLVFYSAILTTMEICHPYSRRPQFTSAFFAALSVCAPTLQRLTIDAPNGAFLTLSYIPLPKLRYLRAVLRADSAALLLRSLVLPATVDVHVEPVVDWRTSAISCMSESVRHEVPFAAIEDAADWGPNPHGLWRFMSVLAAPDQTAGIFRVPAPQFAVRDEGLWSRLDTVGLDIRLDPSTTAQERACGRFPEYVSVAFTRSCKEMEQIHGDPEYDGRGSSPPKGKGAARRSLTVREALHMPTDRARAFRPNLPKPVYECVRYVISLAMFGKPGSLFVGTRSINSAVLHRKSWLPAFPMGWEAILGDLGGKIKDLVFSCPSIRPEVPFTHNMEGCLAPAHLDSLAQYLNAFGDPSKCPCPALKRIHIRRSTAGTESMDAAATRLDAQFNSIRRMNARVPRIVFIIEDE